MKTFVLPTLLVLISNILMGQYKFQENREYKNMKIVLKNGNVLKIQNVRKMNDSLNFFYPIQKNNLTLPIEKVRYVYIKSGSHSGIGAIAGGAFMALSSLSALEQVETNPNLELKENAGGTIALFVIGGAVAGGLIGSAFPKWKPMLIERKKISVRWKPTLDLKQNTFYTGTGFHFSF